MEKMNSMCADCLKRGNGCNGTTCQTWTGCVYRVTILDEMKRQADEINRQKAEAIKTGKNQITYTDHDGKAHTLYYIGGRWVDNGTRKRINQQFPHAVEYGRAAQ